jgi:hypothetical protein
MVRKIILIVIVLAIVSFGALFALGSLSSKGNSAEDKGVEQAKEEKKDVKSNRTIIEIVNPENPNDIKRQWTGYDGLTYKLEAIKNEDGTYTGSIMGLNMYDGFIEYNFKFNNMLQSGFDQLFDK